MRYQILIRTRGGDLLKTGEAKGLRRAEEIARYMRRMQDAIYVGILDKFTNEIVKEWERV